jgi:hypothetical protein
MRQTTVVFLRLLGLASLCSYGRCTPVALPEPQEDDPPLSYNPGGPMIAATATPMSVNPGGRILPTDTPLSFNPGGPMVPETPASEPAPTPMSVQPGGPMKPPHRRTENTLTVPQPTPTPVGNTGKSCTWTISETGAYPCSFNGIETVYPATAINTRYVDCHGCSDIQVDKQIWYCPIQFVTATQVVHTPKTTWTTACATATLPGPPWDVAPAFASPTSAPTAAPEVERRNPQGNLMDQNPAACPTTYVVQPRQTAGPTATRYQQTVTQTVRLPCGGCSLVLSTALAGYGQAGRFTTTMTAPVSTATAYVCQ